MQQASGLDTLWRANAADRDYLPAISGNARIPGLLDPPRRS
jgi:hypothetical protein